MIPRFDIMILGLTPQGLFLLREFSRAGLKVIAVGCNTHVGMKSRYGTKILIRDFHELEHIFNKYLHKDIMIHVASDPFLNYLVDMCPQRTNNYMFFPNYGGAYVFTSKIRTEDLAKNLGIPCPVSFRLSEIPDKSYAHTYPLIAKWNRKYGNEEFKTIIIHSEKELESFKNTHGNNDEIILQNYIPGGHNADISYGGFFQNGKELFHIVVQQKRQYPKGLSSFVEEYEGEHSEKVRNMSRLLMKKTAYQGFVEAEYRINEDEGQVYLIEVNPRVCGWIKIVKKKFDIVWTDLSKIPRTNSEKSVSWVNLVRDARSILNTALTKPHQIDLLDIISDYRNNPIVDIFEWSDPFPFISQFKKIIPHKRKMP